MPRLALLLLLTACTPDMDLAPPFANVPALPELPPPRDPAIPWAGCDIATQVWLRNDLPGPELLAEDLPLDRVEQRFDERGREVSRKAWSNRYPGPEALPDALSEATYEGDRLARQISASTNGVTLAGTDRRYDAAGRLDTEVRFLGWGDDRLDQERWTWTYDAQGRRVTAQGELLQDDRVVQQAWTYEDRDLPDGQHEEITRWYWPSTELFSLTRDVHDEEGRLILRDADEYDWLVDPGVQVPRTRQTWHYDDTGLLETTTSRRSGELDRLLLARRIRLDRSPRGDLLLERAEEYSTDGRTLVSATEVRWERDAEGRPVGKVEVRQEDGFVEVQGETRMTWQDDWSLSITPEDFRVFPKEARPRRVFTEHLGPDGQPVLRIEHGPSNQPHQYDLVEAWFLDDWGRQLGYAYWGRHRSPTEPPEFLLVLHATVDATCP